MTTVEEQGELEKAAAEKILAAEPKFPEIVSTTVELGDDHTGDPAMWIVFHVRQGFEPDEAWVHGFSPYATKVSLKLLHSGLKRFPYTRLKQTP
jgi:hypothetical protein